MFYDYIKKCPLVEQNWATLLRGNKLAGKTGYVYLLIRENSERILVVRDQLKDTVYHVTNKKLMITTGERLRLITTKTILPAVGSEGESLYHTLDEEGREYLDALQKVMDRFWLEQKRSKSMIGRLKNLVDSPVTKLFLLAAIVYAIMTGIVIYSS